MQVLSAIQAICNREFLAACRILASVMDMHNIWESFLPYVNLPIVIETQLVICYNGMAREKAGTQSAESFMIF